MSHWSTHGLISTVAQIYTTRHRGRNGRHKRKCRPRGWLFPDPIVHVPRFLAPRRNWADLLPPPLSLCLCLSLLLFPFLYERGTVTASTRRQFEIKKKKEKRSRTEWIRDPIFVQSFDWSAGKSLRNSTLGFFFFFLETNFLTNKEQMEFFLDFWKFLAIPIESLCNSLVIDFVQDGMESRNWYAQLWGFSVKF